MFNVLRFLIPVTACAVAAAGLVVVLVHAVFEHLADRRVDVHGVSDREFARREAVKR